MLGQRLLLHSPAFLLLAVTNLAVLLWSLRSHPSSDSAGSGLDLSDDSLNATTSLHRSRLRRPSGDETHRQASARTDAELAAGDSGTRSCEVCVSDPGNELCQEYGLDNVRLSRAYEGSGHRVRRVMEKTLRGEKVKIGLLGGSVSFGHGLYGKPTWHERWFEGFKMQFPTAEFQSGAASAMGSGFFAYCWEALIDRDIDLYLIEVDINNYVGDATMRDDDALFRALLGLPHEPAVIRLSVVATSFPELGQGFPSDLAMSTYFDVPIISLRGFLLTHLIQHPEVRDFYSSVGLDGLPDHRHMNELGHQALGDMLTLYINEQICETQRRGSRPPPQARSHWPKEDILGVIPRLYYWKPYDLEFAAPPVKSHCNFAVSSRAPLIPLSDPSLTTPSAWKRIEWNGKAALVASTPGDKIAFEFDGSQVGLFIWQQNGEKKPPGEPKPGQLACWVDSERAKAFVYDLWWDQPFGLSTWRTVREGLSVGRHILHCEIMPETSTGGHEIRITGVAST